MEDPIPMCIWVSLIRLCGLLIIFKRIWSWERNILRGLTKEIKLGSGGEYYQNILGICMDFSKNNKKCYFLRSTIFQDKKSTCIKGLR